MEDTVERRVLAAIRQHPGATPSELRTQARAGLASILEALDTLEEEGRAFRAWAGRRSFAFEGSAPSEAERTALAALAPESARAVAAKLVELGRADIPALAQATGLRPRTVYTHVEALVTTHLAEVGRGRGTARVLVATSHLRRALDRFRPVGTGPPEPSYPS